MVKPSVTYKFIGRLVSAGLVDHYSEQTTQGLGPRHVGVTRLGGSIRRVIGSDSPRKRRMPSYPNP